MMKTVQSDETDRQIAYVDTDDYATPRSLPESKHHHVERESKKVQSSSHRSSALPTFVPAVPLLTRL